MSKKTESYKTIQLSKASFGHHGQTSVILQQIRCYFLYKTLLTESERQTLLKVICCNIKHLLLLNLGQPYFSYEKNTYAYYKEITASDKNSKKMFLDLLASQTLLSMEYQLLLESGNFELKDIVEQIILESKVCENSIKSQITV